jgi:hypothetical protein
MTDSDTGQIYTRAFNLDSVPKVAGSELRSTLRKILSTKHDEEELKTYCFDLGLEYANLRGDTKPAKARELIIYLHNRDRIADLVRLGKQARPDIVWPEVPESTQATQFSLHADPSGHPTSEYERITEKGSQRTEGAASFSIHTLSSRRRRILGKMDRTVTKLKTYVDRYYLAVNAHRLSTILSEQIDLLDSLKPAEDWRGYLRDIRRTFGTSARLATEVGKWREIRRPEEEMSDLTRELHISLAVREDRILALADQHKSIHDKADQLITQLRQLAGEHRDEALGDLIEITENMCANAAEICDELYGGIKKLIAEELDTQLRELGSPGEES